MAQMTYSTIRTTESVLNNVLKERVNGESIRFWEERSGGWGYSESYSFWRIYAATFFDSKATLRLSKSSTFQVISREELENAINLPLAKNWWVKKGAASGSTNTPSLIIMAGPPLSGKTTLAKEIVRRAIEPTVLIENDAIREYIVSELNLATPKYTVSEHRMVYNVSWELIRMALSQHCHVIFDATNRTDGGRAGAYAAASEFNAQVSVVFVKANQETLSARYMAANSEKRKAFDKLGNQVYSYGNCSMPYQVINSNKSEFEMLKELNKFIKIPINFLF